jgi:hypothetical protein
MLFAAAIYIVYLRRLMSHIKIEHGELYKRFGEGRFWYSMPDQLRFLKWLFLQHHREYKDPKLSKLAVITQVLLIIALITTFTMPLAIKGSGVVS